VINWIARFGWSVALIVGAYAALKPESCPMVLAERPVITHVSPRPRPAPRPDKPRTKEAEVYRYSPKSSLLRSNPTWLADASMTITLDPYKSDKAIAMWVWTSPEGHTITAGRNIVILPPKVRR
jgi:hypothetical protein